MRRLSAAALLAVPLLLVAPRPAGANPPYQGFGCGDYCLGMFKKLHQHGPLFNYGPYYGYYPFAPYGPWDAYLRYDPNHPAAFGGNQYGLNPRLAGLLAGLHGLHGHKGCGSCGFHHASWLHGGWFKGHSWLHGSSHGHGHKSSCSTCGGVASATPQAPTGDAFARYSGFGAPAQSAVFYSATPGLNPTLDLVPVGGTK
jgi:hypothetical protein